MKILVKLSKGFRNYEGCHWNSVLISSVISLRISTQMYYNNISADAETLAVGQFAGYIATVFIGIISIIGLVIRKIKSGTFFNKIEK